MSYVTVGSLFLSMNISSGYTYYLSTLQGTRSSTQIANYSTVAALVRPTQLAISPWVDTMSIRQRCAVNRHTMQCIIPWSHTVYVGVWKLQKIMQFIATMLAHVARKKFTLSHSTLTWSNLDTSAFGPTKYSPSRAPAITRTCFGRPTLQKISVTISNIYN